MDIEGCEYITDLSSAEAIYVIFCAEKIVTNTDEMWAILTGEKDGDTKETER